MYELPYLETTEIVRNYALIIGGVVGLMLAGARTVSLSRQAKAQIGHESLARRQHGADLFRQLCQDLHNNDAVVRVAATNGLIGLAAFDPDTLREPVAKVLVLHRQWLEKRKTVGVQVDEELGMVDAFLFSWIEEHVDQMEES